MDRLSEYLGRFLDHQRAQALEAQAIIEHTPTYKVVLLYSSPVFAVIATAIILHLLKIPRPPLLSILTLANWTGSADQADPEMKKYLRAFGLTFPCLMLVTFVLVAFLAPLERPPRMGP